MPPPNTSYEVVFAPSKAVFKETAKRLRNHLGRDLITHFCTLDLLARICGFLDFADFVRFTSSNVECETVAANLDALALVPRRGLQSSILMKERGLSEEDSIRLLDDVVAVGDLVFWAVAKPVLDGDVDAEAGAFPRYSRPATVVPEATGHPVVTYKKRRGMPGAVAPLQA